MSIYALKNIPFKNTTEAYDQWQANHPSEFFFWLLTCKKDDLKRIYPNKSRELLLNYKCNPTLESVLDNWHKNSQFRQGFREWALTNKEIFDFFNKKFNWGENAVDLLKENDNGIIVCNNIKNHEDVMNLKARIYELNNNLNQTRNFKPLAYDVLSDDALRHLHYEDIISWRKKQYVNYATWAADNRLEFEKYARELNINDDFSTLQQDASKFKSELAIERAETKKANQIIDSLLKEKLERFKPINLEVLNNADISHFNPYRLAFLNWQKVFVSSYKSWVYHNRSEFEAYKNDKENRFKIEESYNDIANLFIAQESDEEVKEVQNENHNNIPMESKLSEELLTLKSLLYIAEKCRPTKQHQKDSPEEGILFKVKMVDKDFNHHGKPMINNLKAYIHKLKNPAPQNSRWKFWQSANENNISVEAHEKEIFQQALEFIADSIKPSFFNGPIKSFGGSHVNPFNYKFAFYLVNYFNKNKNTNITQVSYDLEMTREQYMNGVAEGIRKYSNSLNIEKMQQPASILAQIDNSVDYTGIKPMKDSW